MGIERNRERFFHVTAVVVSATVRATGDLKTIGRSGHFVSGDGAAGAAGVRRNAAGSGGYRSTIVPSHQPIFNTEKTAIPRRATKEGTVALRAKRLMPPKGASRPTGSPPPDTFVALRGISVFSVLKMRSRARPGPIPGRTGSPARPPRQSATPGPFTHATAPLPGAHAVPGLQRRDPPHMDHAGTIQPEQHPHPVPHRSAP